MSTLVDSNVLIDVLSEDARWFEWSSQALAHAAEQQLSLALCVAGASLDDVLLVGLRVDEQVVAAEADLVAQDAAGRLVDRDDVILDHVDVAVLDQLIVDVERVRHVTSPS